VRLITSFRFWGVGLGLLLVMIALSLVGLGLSISGTWNRSEALHPAIHQSSTALWVSRNVMVSEDHGRGVREECCV